MPSFRGIEISLITKPGDEPIPEYPHPDSSLARLVGDGSKDVCHQKSNPTISVYMPSVPGSAFAINYTIRQLNLAEAKYMFFKLYINGRGILSWGIEPVLGKTRQVVRSIWAPGGHLAYQAGLEERNFVFLPGQENKSAAEDGGLIEIQAFRAKGRSAKAPKVEEFRHPQAYGIAVPSVGLLDKPEDARFFDYCLLDAKDSPYATFKLHYRSMNSLQQLNLVTSPVIGPRSLPLETEHPFGRKAEAKINTPDEAVFGAGSDSRAKSTHFDVPDRTASSYFLKSPPERLPRRPSTRTIPQPGKGGQEGISDPYLQRPLPALPVAEPGTRSRRSSRASSAGSSAPSVAASLISKLSHDSFDQSGAECGVARAVQIHSIKPTTVSVEGKEGNDENQDHNIQQLADCSISDYEVSPLSTCNSESEYPVSPNSYLPTTGSSFDFDLEQFSSPRRPSSQSLYALMRIDRNAAPSPSGPFRNFSRPGCLPTSSSESGGLGRVAASEAESVSPSPAQRRISRSVSEQYARGGHPDRRPIPPPKDAPVSGGQNDIAPSAGAGTRQKALPKRLPAAWNIFDSRPAGPSQGNVLHNDGSPLPLVESPPEMKLKVKEEQNRKPSN
ncbi:hypothetical protein QBC37DRAFT_461735 [Rhypophila decipiens]|uniref:Uncharacterized protein n=1 Tax=Rhypophila decipiens TaxID=261697 RepID=A0AAN6YH51_9PEZI|nr:hypothetical protein QBC37DRAFT_461735 [Rhypophila decipiens]